jgi:hypothetical protein
MNLSLIFLEHKACQALTPPYTIHNIIDD